MYRRLKKLGKQTIEFSDTLPMGEWREVKEAGEGIFEKILSFDPETGNISRLLRLQSGAKIEKTQSHDFCEEVYILDGYMIDTVKKITAAPGYYACRPVGMIHGPYVVPVSCLSFETRYQDPAKPLNPDCSLMKQVRSEKI